MYANHGYFGGGADGDGRFGGSPVMHRPGGPTAVPPGYGRRQGGAALAVGIVLWSIAGGGYLLGLAFLAMAGVYVLAAGGPWLLVLLAAVLPVVLALAPSLVIGATPGFRGATRGAQVLLLAVCFTTALLVSWGGLLAWASSAG